MESDKTEVNPGSERYGERLNRPIEVFVVEGVFIVPLVWAKSGDFVTHKPDTIISRFWLDLIDCRPCANPFHNRRLHPGCRRHCSETEGRVGTADAKLTVGDVVKHVALAGMGHTPGVLARSDICRFGKIDGTLIEICIQVADVYTNPVRHTIVSVPGMIHYGGLPVVIVAGGEIAGERIDPNRRRDALRDGDQEGAQLPAAEPHRE